jgi:hypothetical protein
MSRIVEDDDFQALREAQREMAIRRYGRWLAMNLASSPIEFYTEVKIDDYYTVTVGEWGGYLVQIMPMIFNDRLVLTPQSCLGVYDHGWCFDKGPAALLAALVWNPETEGEPVGYKKRATAGVRQAGDRADGALTPGAARGLALMAALDLLQPVKSE